MGGRRRRDEQGYAFVHLTFRRGTSVEAEGRKSETTHRRATPSVNPYRGSTCEHQRGRLLRQRNSPAARTLHHTRYPVA